MAKTITPPVPPAPSTPPVPPKKHLARLLIPIALVLVVAGGLMAVALHHKKGNGASGETAHWTSGCQSNERITLTHTPMDLPDVATLTPVGLVAGAHVTPIDHLYFYPKAKERDAAPVYAMADGYIQDISERDQSVDTGKAKQGEFRVIMQHSCQTITYFDLLTSLDPAIEKDWKAHKLGDLHIPIKAGQIIGRIGGQSLDTAVYNMKMTLPGFIHPQLYDAEPWKVHTDDFYTYFVDPLRSQLLAKNQRKVPPYGGKIDYDQPGKLIGNWFLEGTNGYAGPQQLKVGSGGHGNWDGHLAIFYDAFDGKTVTISVGRFGADGLPQAFVVTGNQPDPALINQASGITKYELRKAPPGITPDGSAPMQSQNNPVEGTALFQVLGGEKLKVEFFAGQSAAQVTTFTSAAKTYER